jgi:lipopolysaccharide/colanic/teichoic acid biosynthesis glycosyltransferase
VLNPGWLIFEASCHTNPVYEVTKRAFDIAISIFLLTIISPIIFGVMLAIWIEDGIGAPVFYRQERVGKAHKIFKLLKFRSMVTDAERSGPQWASSDDDRVTVIGRIIRRFRLDELPQLINVLLGDMSIVGPRPERPEFIEEISAIVSFYDYRHCVRPGMTGWAQLNFPYGSSVADAREKLKYDLYYIKNGDIVFDLFILLQTFEVVIWGRATSMAGPDVDASNSDPTNAPIRLFERRKRDAS